MEYEVIKTLEGRDRQMVGAAVAQIGAAAARVQQAKDDEEVRRQHVMALLQMAIGEGYEGVDLGYDQATGEVFPLLPTVDQQGAEQPAGNSRKTRPKAGANRLEGVGP